MAAITQLREIRQRDKTEIAELNALITGLTDTRTVREIQRIIRERLETIALDVRLTQGEPDSDNRATAVLVKQARLKGFSDLLDRLDLIIERLRVDEPD